MRLLREMETIQIDITNACTHACSNCSRMCGNHKTPFFMDFETFKKAVDSLEDFEGMVGIIGGEPLLHPEFARIMEYAGSVKRERIVKDRYFNKPKKDYLQAMYSYSAVMKQIAKASGIVLTSSMPKPYYRHYERITDTATFYRINDHSKPSYHQPSMISYRDLGIPDDEFAALRDNCWLHGRWSATIMPKGAFFCEMAGALDQLFDGPGGWTIEPGWWKREISDYAEQWSWCELCGMCLPTCTRDANEEVDDVSETLYQMLKEIDSPRIKQGKVHIYTAKEQDERSKATIAGNYMLDYKERLGASRQNLLPQSIRIIPEDKIDAIFRKKEELFAYDWIAVPQTTNQEILTDAVSKLGRMFMNPGVLYQLDIAGCKAKIFNAKASALASALEQAIAQPEQMITQMKRTITRDVGADKCGEMSQTESLLLKRNETGQIERNEISQNGMNWLAALACWPQDKRYTLKEGFEEDPDVDLDFYEEKMLSGYQNDRVFMAELARRLGEGSNRQGEGTSRQEESSEDPGESLGGLEKREPVLLPMVSNLQNMRAVARLLTEVGYEVHVMAARSHKDGLTDLLTEEKLHLFDYHKFDYDRLRAFADAVKARHTFGGCLIPTSATADHLNHWDGYDGAIRLMEYMQVPICGIINAKRRFCVR